MINTTTAERITRELDGDWHGHYGTAPAPGHSKRDRSMSIRPHPSNPDDIIVHCFAGESWQEAKLNLRRCGLLSGSWKRDPEAETDEQKRRRKIEAARRKADSTADRLRIALWHLDRSMPAKGTVVSTYLRSRGIQIGSIPATIRYSPANPPKYPHPAMVAAFGMPEEPEPGVLHMSRERLKGIHITLLQPDGSGKADIERERLMIGHSKGWPIVLTPTTDGLGLGIAEGIETALSMHTKTGLGVWAAGTAGRLPALADKVPAYIEVVTLALDSDPAGRRGSEQLAEQLCARGIEVRMAEVRSGA